MRNSSGWLSVEAGNATLVRSTVMWSTAIAVRMVLVVILSGEAGLGWVGMGRWGVVVELPDQQRCNVGWVQRGGRRRRAAVWLSIFFSAYSLSGPCSRGCCPSLPAAVTPLDW